MDSERFFLFQLAEQQHKTVAELLTGKPLPLSNQEFVQWGAYYNVKRSKEEKEAKKNSPRRRGRRR